MYRRKCTHTMFKKKLRKNVNDDLIKFTRQVNAIKRQLNDIGIFNRYRDGITIPYLLHGL